MFSFGGGSVDGNVSLEPELLELESSTSPCLDFSYSGCTLGAPEGRDVVGGSKHVPRFPEKPEWYEILEEELKRISIGKVVFNPPDTMKVGVRERVEVRISKDSKADLVAALKGRGIAQIKDVKVSEFMKVRVSGNDFDITQLNEEEQFIETQGFTEWAWDIIPKKSGKAVLHLHVTLRIRLPFGEERKDHPVLDREVIVKVNPIYSTGIFVSTYWKWIVMALIALIGLIWKIFKQA